MGSCSNKCYDCKEVIVKQIIVEDEEGNNLIFGDSSVYSFDSIQLKDKNGILIYFYERAGNKSLEFGLESNYNTCYLYLNSTETDTITFNLYEQNSESCCGRVTYSSNTYVNNEEIENNTVIRIIKQGQKK